MKTRRILLRLFTGLVLVGSYILFSCYEVIQTITFGCIKLPKQAISTSYLIIMTKYLYIQWHLQLFNLVSHETLHQFECFIYLYKFHLTRNKSFLDNGMYIQIPVENHNSHNFQPCDGKKKIFRFTVYVFRVPI